MGFLVGPFTGPRYRTGKHWKSSDHKIPVPFSAGSHRESTGNRGITKSQCLFLRKANRKALEIAGSQNPSAFFCGKPTGKHWKSSDRKIPVLLTPGSQPESTGNRGIAKSQCLFLREANRKALEIAGSRNPSAFFSGEPTGKHWKSPDHKIPVPFSQGAEESI